ncbi:hypothetical protein YC2023_039525 [Brassica napus]
MANYYFTSRFNSWAAVIGFLQLTSSPPSRSTKSYSDCKSAASIFTNSSLRHWQQMGGLSIQEDMFIYKSIRRSVNSRALGSKAIIFNWKIIASIDCMWMPCPVVSIHCLAALPSYSPSTNFEYICSKKQ